MMQPSVALLLSVSATLFFSSTIAAPVSNNKLHSTQIDAKKESDTNTSSTKESLANQESTEYKTSNVQQASPADGDKAAVSDKTSHGHLEQPQRQQTDYEDVENLLLPFRPSRAFAAPGDITEKASIQQLLSAGAPPQVIPDASEIDLSPRAMAEYLLLTNDFDGLKEAIADLVSAGLLSEKEAEGYEDAVNLEFLTMLYENEPRNDAAERNEFRRQMRLPDEFEDRIPSISYDTDGDYVVYEMPVEAESYSPSAPKIDERFLEELIQQAGDYTEGDSPLQSELEDAANGQSKQEDLDQTQLRHDGAVADDSALSLEAELESLPVGNGPISEEKQSRDVDDDVLELERIGKLKLQLKHGNREGRP